jgi:hypothetical protein
MIARIAWIVCLRPMFFRKSGDKQQVNGTVDDNCRLQHFDGDNTINSNKNKKMTG